MIPYSYLLTMGIKDLNQYFIKNSKDAAIQKIHLQTLTEKVVAIDASIYIYRFLGEPDGLIPNLYSMVTTLLSYKIIPIFIFDGKTPVEKRPLVIRRQAEKKDAAEKYNALVDAAAAVADASEQTPSKREMEELRKKSIRLTYDDLDNTKLLLDAFGISYMRAPGEADALCALLVRRGFAWACMSDDMDLFLYGCSRVLRYFNLYDHTAIIYNTREILAQLDIIEKDFVEAVVLTGTDYNAPYENMTLVGSLAESRAKPGEINLYDHLGISSGDKEVLYKICVIFHIDNMEFDANSISVKSPVANWKEIRGFLKGWGFVFL
jgi:hypothetical protein